MSAVTAIDWTDATPNPLTHHCDPVGPECDNCLAPETRVLTSAGAWKPIGALIAGDLLLGFDENGPNRSMQVTTVERAWRTRAATIKLTTQRGITVTASPNHRWLLETSRGGAWRETRDLRLGDRIRVVGNPFAPEITAPDYLAGYLCGATAGDGTFRYDETWGSTHHGHPQVYWRVAVAADDKAVLDRLVTALEQLGVQVTIRPFDSGNAAGNPMLKVETRAREPLKIIRDLLAAEDGPAAWKAGWLAGFLDTDGSVSRSIRWSQVAGRNNYLERTLRYLSDLGFQGVHEKYHCHPETVRLLTPTNAEKLRLLTTIRPALPRKGLATVHGSRIPTETDEIVSLARGPERDLVDITTSTRTFIAEGLATHNCYAMTIADHWHGRGFFTSAPPVIVPERLFLPWKDRKMREEAYRQFICSMSDPFHGRLPFSDQALLWAWMAADRRKVKQVLTKRGGIMQSRLNSARFEAAAYAHLDTLERMALSAKRVSPWRQAMAEDIQAAREEWTWPPRNVWLGVSVGLQDSSRRLDQLVATPAVTRIVSCEPLIGELVIKRWISGPGEPLIHQVIGGGESGARHRPVDLGHARLLRDQCTDAGVPFWWKQNGGRTHRSGGDLLDGLRWKQFPHPALGALR